MFESDKSFFNINESFDQKIATKITFSLSKSIMSFSRLSQNNFDIIITVIGQFRPPNITGKAHYWPDNTITQVKNGTVKSTAFQFYFDMNIMLVQNIKFTQ